MFDVVNDNQNYDCYRYEYKYYSCSQFSLILFTINKTNLIFQLVHQLIFDQLYDAFILNISSRKNE